MYAFRSATLASNMAHSPPLPPQLPRFEPSGDASLLVVLEEMSPLPPPALAIWNRLALVRFYGAHQDLKQDLLKKRTRGVCTIRFRRHCQRVPQRGSAILRETSLKKVSFATPQQSSPQGGPLMVRLFDTV